jgi:hypothetical protein
MGTVNLLHMINTEAKCTECNRVFDFFDKVDAEEWHYGHDCEEE